MCNTHGSSTCTGTQAHRHTGTQAPRHTGTQAPRHTGTQARDSRAARPNLHPDVGVISIECCQDNRFPSPSFPSLQSRREKNVHVYIYMYINIYHTTRSWPGELITNVGG